MNQFVPNWSMEGESRSLRDLLAAPNQKKAVVGADNDELIELLWQNGHVVLQSQAHRKPPASAPEFKQVRKHDESVPNTSHLNQDETAAWFEESIDRDLYSEVFFDMPAIVQNEVVNFSHLSKQWKGDAGAEKSAGASSSMMTAASSVCELNCIACGGDAEGSASRSLKEEAHTRLASQEAAVASSSGGSGCSFGRTGQNNNNNNNNNKRKGRGMEEFESLVEGAENESVDDANNRAQRSTSTRRIRAAEVHNLSERRRRDRINEKMRALQELIPHCNKGDKASILDEAIEYLKSLQLQVQFLWMGIGTGPMMFRGFHQHMPRVGTAAVPSLHSPIQMPRVPYMNNQFMASTSTAREANFSDQMPNAPLGAGLVGLNHFQPQSQATNCDAYAPRTAQQHQSSAEPSSVALPVSGVSPSKSTPKDKAG